MDMFKKKVAEEASVEIKQEEKTPKKKNTVATVINDLSYILGQLNSKDRQALIDAVSALIDEASKTEG